MTKLKSLGNEWEGPLPFRLHEQEVYQNESVLNNLFNRVAKLKAWPLLLKLTFLYLGPG